jgi:cell division protein FtsI (penicillin-binding protein 3)
LQPVRTKKKKTTLLNVRRASFVAAPSLKKRLRWALAILLLLLAVLVAQVSRLQLFGGDKFRAAGEDIRVRATTLPAERGAIFDRTGQEIAMSVPMRTLYADPKAVTDPVGAARAISSLMRFDAAKEAELAATFAARESNFSFIARQVDPKIVKAIIALKIPGIGSYEEPSRTIVGVSAKSVVGKTDTDGVGTAGLELKYNDILTGKNGRFVREQDNQGRSIPGSNSAEVRPQPGGSLCCRGAAR